MLKLSKQLISLTMALALLSGCGAKAPTSSASSAATSATASTSSASAATSSAPAASADPVTLQMWYHISETQAKVLLTQLEEFQQLNPNIKIETQSLPFAEIKKQISIGSAAAQLPDLSLCDTVDNASFGAMGSAVDITDEINAWGEMDNFYDGPRSSASYNDRIYGIPYYSNCLAIMYNKDILDEMGIAYPTSDWNWAQFQEMVAKATTPEHFGLTTCLFKSEEGTFNTIPFIWQAGADYDNLDSPEALEALTMIDDFYQKGYMSKELVSMTQADMCKALFSTGKSALMVGGTWLTANIAKENPNLNYGVVTFPANKNTASPIGGGNLMMLNDKNKEATLQLMQFLASKEKMADFCEAAGYLPARKDSAELKEVWKTDEKMSIYRQQLETARARGPHPQWPQISSAIQFAVQDTLSKTKTAQQALKDAAAEIAKIQ